MSGVDMLGLLQHSARNGTLLASCEPEVKELMHQIDILITRRTREWEGQLQALRTQLQSKESEVSAVRVAMQERNTLIEQLKYQCVVAEQEEKTRKEECETKVSKLRKELNRLGQSYEQLKASRRAHSHSDRRGGAGGGSDHSAARKQLKQDLELLQRRNERLEGDKEELEKRLSVEKSVTSSQQEKCSTLEKDLVSCRSQLKQAQESASSREQLVKTLKKEREQARRDTQLAVTEQQKALAQLSETQIRQQEYETLLAEARTESKRKGGQLKHLESELVKKEKNLQLLQETVHSKDKFIRSLESHQKLAQCVEVREEVAQLRTRVNQGDHLQDQLKAAMHRADLSQQECVKLKSELIAKTQQLEEEKLALVRGHKATVDQLSAHSASMEREIAALKEARLHQQMQTRERRPMEALEERVRALEMQVQNSTRELRSNREMLKERGRQLAVLRAENHLLRTAKAPLSTVSLSVEDSQSFLSRCCKGEEEGEGEGEGEERRHSKAREKKDESDESNDNASTCSSILRPTEGLEHRLVLKDVATLTQTPSSASISISPAPSSLTVVPCRHERNKTSNTCTRTHASSSSITSPPPPSLGLGGGACGHFTSPVAAPTATAAKQSPSYNNNNNRSSSSSSSSPSTTGQVQRSSLRTDGTTTYTTTGADAVSDNTRPTLAHTQRRSTSISTLPGSINNLEGLAKSLDNIFERHLGHIDEKIQSCVTTRPVTTTQTHTSTC